MLETTPSQSEFVFIESSDKNITASTIVQRVVSSPDTLLPDKDRDRLKREIPVKRVYGLPDDYWRRREAERRRNNKHS